MDTNVHLTDSELQLGAQAGLMRLVENLRVEPSRRPANGQSKANLWQENIEGCLGEMALAKFLNTRWKGKGELGEKDVGAVDVRTRACHDYDLIVQQRDPDDVKIWLLTGRYGDYIVQGWIWGRDAKKREYWSEKGQPGRPAYFVPKEKLIPPVPFDVAPDVT